MEIQMVKIYTSPTCGKCKQLKAFCEKNEIAITEVDITEDFKVRAYLLSKNRMDLPVVEKDGVILEGSFLDVQKALKIS